MLKSCNNCTHATYRVSCAIPILAGISDKDGVIMYHPQNDINCSAWEYRISLELESLIKSSALKNNWDEADLIRIYQPARNNPASLVNILTL